LVASAPPVHGHDAIEFMLEDGTDSPFVMLCAAEHCNRRITGNSKSTSMMNWTRRGATCTEEDRDE
jgi:hypothetical protein